MERFQSAISESTAPPKKPAMIPAVKVTHRQIEIISSMEKMGLENVFD
jgi:hypothetical protein